MAERAYHYGPGLSDPNSFDENSRDHRVAPYELRQSVPRDLDQEPFVDREPFVPLFLSEDYGEPEPSEYISPLRKRRGAAVSSKILAAVCAAAAAAVLFALFSSDGMRDFVKPSMASIVPALVAAQSDSSRLTVAAGKDLPRSLAPEKIPDARNVATASVTPSREEMKSAYQSALQVRAPVAAAVEEPVPPVNAYHRLDPNEIAAALKRADALIASGDLAAARLVLRRAADDGDAQAAITLAGTYDPAVLDRLGVHGIVPDVVMARGWYEKARKFGAAEATQRLEVLASKYR